MKTILSYTATLLLSIFDVVTTYSVLSSGVGYEVNPFIRSLIGVILPLKLIGITALYLTLPILIRNERIFNACLIFIPLFYAVIVLNNLGVLLGLFCLSLNMEKICAIAVLIFTASLGSQLLPSRTP